VSTPNYALAERLSRTRSKAAELRTRRNEAMRELDAAKSDFAGAQREGKMTDWPEFKASERATFKVNQLDDEIEALGQEESFLLAQMAGVTSPLRQGDFLSNTPMLAALEGLAHSSAPIGNMHLGLGMDVPELVQRLQSGEWGPRAMAGAMAMAADGITSASDAMRSSGGVQRVLSAPRRRLRLLDLIPSAPHPGGSTFTYSQEVITSEAPAETAEGAIKPQSEYDWIDAEAKAVTIPHFTKLSRQTLADVPSLQRAVEGRLTYGVLKRVEDQIVGGAGAGENMRGILNTVGIAAVAFDAGTPVVELPLEGIVDVINSDAEPTAVVVNAADYWLKFATAKNAGDGAYVGGGPFGSGYPTLWGLPAIPSRAIASGKALVGDWTNGATLFVREGVNVRMSDSDQDDFVRNRVTLLGEGRFALVIWSPASFAEVDLAAA
jgi:hypothetical protein